MVYANWNGTQLAKSDKTIVIEGNQYFPKGDVDLKFLESSDYHTRCPWKGLASYYDVVVDGKRNANVVWYYPEPMEKAEMIKDYIAFWNGVEVRVD